MPLRRAACPQGGRRRRRFPIMPARRRFWSAIRRFLHTDPFPSAAHRAGRTMTQTAVGL
ncbi:hypothetical protein BURMUCF2_0446 [Burkholderia multivorans CF2]|nr:hypothetical protein BURMUCF2_0446 [Burkholderia multivorans CF2]